MLILNLEVIFFQFLILLIFNVGGFLQMASDKISESEHVFINKSL